VTDHPYRQTSHHVQIYFSYLCLDMLLRDSKLQPAETAAIWLPPNGSDSAPPSLRDLKAIKLSLLSDSMNDFLFLRLPRILGTPRDDVSWHYNPLCRSCPYTHECRTRSKDEKTFGFMPNISVEQAKVLEHLLTISQGGAKTRGVTDIEDLHTLIEDHPRLAVLETSSPSTVRNAKRILGIPIRRSRETTSSAIVEAARKETIQVSEVIMRLCCAV
jgi:hypothetical protein